LANLVGQIYLRGVIYLELMACRMKLFARRLSAYCCYYWLRGIYT